MTSFIAEPNSCSHLSSMNVKHQAAYKYFIRDEKKRVLLLQIDALFAESKIEKLIIHCAEFQGYSYVCTRPRSSHGAERSRKTLMADELGLNIDQTC